MSVRRGDDIIAGLPIIDGSLNTSSQRPIANAPVALAVSNLNDRIDTIISGSGNFLFSVELSETQLSELDSNNQLLTNFFIPFSQTVDFSKTFFNSYYVVTTAMIYWPVGTIIPAETSISFLDTSTPTHPVCYLMPRNSKDGMCVYVPQAMDARLVQPTETTIVSQRFRHSYNVDGPGPSYNYVKLVIDAYKLRN